jgi:RAT1-interacting protein
MAPSKRSIAELLNDDDDSDKRQTKPRLDYDAPQNQEHQSTSNLRYPSISSQSPTRPTPFQKPVPLLTFSYNSSRVLEFTDSALRYFTQPPPYAKLNHGYDRWIRRPEQKGRVDGLVTAWDRLRRNMGTEGAGIRGMDVGLIAWRGVMTRYAGLACVHNSDFSCLHLVEREY